MRDFVKLNSAANFRTMHCCLALYVGCFPKLLLNKCRLLEKGGLRNTYLVLADKLHHLIVQWMIHTLQQCNFFIPHYLLSGLTNFSICVALIPIIKSSLYVNKLTKNNR